MKYCSHCRSSITMTTPTGDNRPRFTCSGCDFIFYENPKIIAGAIPVYKNKILLCKRNIEPRLGYWTLPAGFLENGETVQAGAQRETLEETQNLVTIGPLFSICNVIHVNQVHLFYHATMTDDHFGPTSESSEVNLFAEADIPWDELAFNTVRQTLQQFFLARKEGKTEPQVAYGLHHFDIT